MPGYDDNYTNKASIVDGAINSADHVKSLYDELGANPSGGAADLATRLSSMIDGDGTITDVVAVTQAEYDAIDPYDATTLYVIDGGLSFAIGGTNTPPPSGWTLEGDPPPAPEVLSGYTRTWLEDFDDDAWKADYWVKDGTWQGDPWPQGTVSVQSSANVITTSGVARFKVDDSTATIGSYTRPYTSSEVESLASARLPLTGRYETCMRGPQGHANWWCWWFTAGGSYSNLELDITEMFHAQSPGMSDTVMHSPDGHGGDNLRGFMFGGASSQSTSTYLSSDAYDAGGRWHIPTSYTAIWPDSQWTPADGKTHWAGHAFPWADYQNGATDPQPWVTACVEIYKVDRNASVGATFWSNEAACDVNPARVLSDQSQTTNYTIVMEYSRNYHDGNGWQKYLVYVDPYDPVNGATGSLPWEQEGTNNVPFWVGRLLDGSVTEDKFWENKFDHWIGGQYIGAALDHGAGAGTPNWGTVARNYDYTGYLQNGEYYTSSNLPANPAYVTDSTAARYPMYMDVAWQQRLETPIPNPPPAGTLNTGATFNLAAVGSPADGTAVSDINSSSPNSNLSDLADDTGGDGVATSATWQTDSPFPETTYTIEHATAVSGRSMMKYSYGSDFSQFAARMLIQFNGSAVYDGDGHEIIMIAKTGADNTVAYLRMDLNGYGLRLSATGNSTVDVTGATVANMTTGKLYGIEMIFNYISASSVDITVRVLNITDGTWVTSVAGFTQNYTTVTNSTTIQKIWFGSDQAALDATKPFRTGAYAVSVNSVNPIGFYEDDPTS